MSHHISSRFFFCVEECGCRYNSFWSNIASWNQSRETRVCLFWRTFLHQETYPVKKRIWYDIWGSLRWFVFHYGCILDRCRCQLSNCLLVRQFRRFRTPLPSIWICRSPLGAASAPRAYNSWHVDDLLIPNGSKNDCKTVRNISWEQPKGHEKKNKNTKCQTSKPCSRFGTVHF